MNNDQRTHTMNTDPFIYIVVRTYNLMSKRDNVKRFNTYFAAHTAMQTLNTLAADTSYIQNLLEIRRHATASRKTLLDHQPRWNLPHQTRELHRI